MVMVLGGRLVKVAKSSGREVDVATVTAAEFNQRPSQVKRAAEDEPVVITEHSRPSFVLLTYAEYQRLLRTPTDLADWLEMDEEIEFEIEPVGLDIRPADV
jgi:prevent-host-death family protein